MYRLIPGIREFRENVFPSQQARFEELAAGQKPATLFITCSDSRIDPNLLTQTEPGDLFVLRNAGNLVPPCPCADEFGGEAATIEYAVKALQVQEIVVCGHSHCGAITGVLRPELLRSLPRVEKWLTYAERLKQEIADQRLPVDGSDDVLTTAIKANVLVQLGHLRTYPEVAEAEQRGELTLHGCFYRFETGEVLAYDSTANKFASVLHELATERTVA
jgi:carbonic anhydrase